MEKQLMLVEKKRFRPLHIVLVALAVLSALVTLATFGVSLPFSIFKPLEISGPTIADSNGNVTAIVDSESRRVLLLDKNFDLTGIIDFKELNAPLEAVNDVCVTDEAVYVAGVQYKEDSDIIVDERVVAYNTSGGMESIVFDREVANELTPQIQAMDASDDGVHVVLCDENTEDVETQSIEIVHVSAQGVILVEKQRQELFDVYDIGYSSRNNVLQTLSQRGVVADGFDVSEEADHLVAEHVFTSIDVGDDGCTYLYDDVTSSICTLTADGDFAVVTSSPGYGNLHVNGDVLCACNHRENKVSIGQAGSTSPTTITEVTPVAHLLALAAIIRTCQVYLGLFAAAILLYKLYHAVKQNDTEGIGALFVSATIVLATAMAIGYVTYEAYRSMNETRSEEINLFADYLTLSSDHLSEAMRTCENRSVFREKGDRLLEAYAGLAEIESTVGNLVLSATTNGVGTYSIVYGADEDGVFRFTTAPWTMCAARVWQMTITRGKSKRSSGRAKSTGSCTRGVRCTMPHNTGWRASPTPTMGARLQAS